MLITRRSRLRALVIVFAVPPFKPIVVTYDGGAVGDQHFVTFIETVSGIMRTDGVYQCCRGHYFCIHSVVKGVVCDIFKIGRNSDEP